MHELGICDALLKMVDQIAKDEQLEGRSVRSPVLFPNIWRIAGKPSSTVPAMSTRNLLLKFWKEKPAVSIAAENSAPGSMTSWSALSAAGISSPRSQAVT